LNDDDEDTCRDCSSQLTSLLSEIQEGEPVQKVGFINYFATVFAFVCHFPTLNLIHCACVQSTAVSGG
jgi:hypothetical protein